MAAAACVGATVHGEVGMGRPVPLTCDDTESLVPSEDASEHLAGVPLPGGGLAAAEHGELLIPLLVASEKEHHAAA